MLLISDQQVTEAFSTLLRRPGLRASNGGVLATTRTQNVSEYMLVLALCLVFLFITIEYYERIYIVTVIKVEVVVGSRASDLQSRV